jgi:hypothetical protein
MATRRLNRRRAIRLSPPILSIRFAGMEPEDIGRHLSRLPARSITWNEVPRSLMKQWARIPLEIVEYRENGSRYFGLHHHHVGITNSWYYNRMGNELAHVYQKDSTP